MTAIYKAGRVGGVAVYSAGNAVAGAALVAAAAASGIASASLSSADSGASLVAHATASGAATAALRTAIRLQAAAMASGVASAYLTAGEEPPTDTPVLPQYTIKPAGRKLVMTMSSISNPGFSDKDPWERLPLGFDFARDLEAIGSTLAASPAPVVTITAHSGTEDTNPAAVLDGSPWISGSIVKQWVDDGIVGARYLVRCEAYTESGARLVMSGTMMVRTK